MRKATLASKEMLNPGEAVTFYNLSARKLRRFLKNNDRLPFLVFYRERKLIICSAFEEYLNSHPALKEELKNGKPRIPKKT